MMITNPDAVSPADRICGVDSNVTLIDDSPSLTPAELQVIDSILEGRNAGPCGRPTATGLVPTTDPPVRPRSSEPEPATVDSVARPPRRPFPDSSAAARYYRRRTECRRVMRQRIQQLGAMNGNRQTLAMAIGAVADGVLNLGEADPDARAAALQAIGDYFHALAAIPPLAEETRPEYPGPEAVISDSVLPYQVATASETAESHGPFFRSHPFFVSNTFSFESSVTITADAEIDPASPPEPMNSVPPDLNRRLSAGRRRLLNPFTVPATREQQPG
jgi:hypothetical protein